jgi:hypothetical protein
LQLLVLPVQSGLICGNGNPGVKFSFSISPRAVSTLSPNSMAYGLETEPEAEVGESPHSALRNPKSLNSSIPQFKIVIACSSLFISSRLIGGLSAMTIITLLMNPGISVAGSPFSSSRWIKISGTRFNFTISELGD